jgi:tetratricopeptide (TPR) repeat protein
MSDDDVRAAMQQAYALDRAGDERGAIVHYDRAFRLGVPDAERKRFLVGYGSTLRNVGRVDEAVAVLAEAVRSYPDYPALQAFLALALSAAGQPHAALATMLGVVLDLSHAGQLDGYDRALAEYHDELLAKVVAPPQ